MKSFRLVIGGKMSERQSIFWNVENCEKVLWKFPLQFRSSINFVRSNKNYENDLFCKHLYYLNNLRNIVLFAIDISDKRKMIKFLIKFVP